MPDDLYRELLEAAELYLKADPSERCQARRRLEDAVRAVRARALMGILHANTRP